MVFPLVCSQLTKGHSIIKISTLGHEIEPELTDDIVPKKPDGHIWLDIININQNARNINKELDIIPTVYKNAQKHIMISRSDLTRGWCYFEYAIRTKAFPYGGTIFPEQHNDISKAVVYLKDFEGTEQVRDYIRQETFRFSRTKFTVESDRENVSQRIVDLFENLESAEKQAKDAFYNEDWINMQSAPLHPKFVTMDEIENLVEVAAKFNIIIPEYILDGLKSFH